MESSFKSFDNFTDSQASDKSRRRYIVRRASLNEVLYILAVLFFAMGFALHYGRENHQWLALSIIAASLLLTLVSLARTDYLSIDSDNEVRLVRHSVFFRRTLSIPKLSIEFVGIGGGEKFADAGNLHLVYIRHGQEITPLRRFVAGRDAVVMAKEIRQFLRIN